ncbi:hypothetical protein AB0N60_36870 [Streptomyces microflavus]|uniref:hypothetical protein n=1 Tax=Streptomyces microflavus TaxID=1919 RepID=UPI00342B6449
MTFIEPGLCVRNGFAEGPLADAPLSHAAQLLDDLQEQAPTLTDGQLRDGVHRALRCFTREQSPACQVGSFTALIRLGVRIDCPVPGRLRCPDDRAGAVAQCPGGAVRPAPGELRLPGGPGGVCRFHYSSDTS